MQFKQKQDGSVSMVFSDEEIKILQRKKSLSFSPSMSKEFLNNMANALFSMNERLPKNLQDKITDKTDQEIVAK